MKLSRLLFALLLCLSAGGAAWGQTKLTVLQDITFATNVKTCYNTIDNLQLDIYYPPEATADKKYPVLIFCHGGSFTSGDKSNVSSECDLFAKQGFAVVAANYRTGYAAGNARSCNADTVTMQEAIYRGMQDINACMRFLAANAAAYSLDTANSFMGGTSAGATLTLYDCYINDSVAQVRFPGIFARLGSLDTSGNKLTNKYSIKGICAMWGALPAFGLITKKSAIPAILFKGGKDTNLPNGTGTFQNCPNYPVYLAGIGIYNETLKAGKACVYHYQPLGQHAAYDDIFCAENTGCFFRAIVNRQPYSAYLYSYTSSCQ